ncbi:DNA repair protein RadC [Flavobacterium sp. NKUCC04_CG]|uniref:RadC family protein n=1 Tax=Flavobacterium sp. NKUCC04_CG TaxID=2842121 RepID=UPI001C5ABBCB|nr:DNA repair protein RadC [Flavobacterium sp. NKUCC04_CG]MBW3517650.1 DNA repair protein RadC [Flavobacterium sp. NKUCC04_CG]
MKEYKGTSIKSWAEDDKPREKLMLKGKAALSDAELLAILLRSGSTDQSAVDLSKRILNEYDNKLSNLSKQSLKQLLRFKGVGQAKAISIVAALELGQRRQREMGKLWTKIESSRMVYDLMQPIIGDLAHEEFWVLLLNNSNKIIHQQKLSIGGLTATVVDVRILFKLAIEHQAVGIILCHNHPSGQLTPSETDLRITRKIKQAALLFDISILDHLIVTEKDYYSFADENIL